MMIDHLGLGAENARSISDIAESLHINRRRAEIEIRALVDSNVPIIACERGVYLETDPDAVDAYADALEARIRTQLEKPRALRRMAERMRQERQGQPRMPWAA